MKLMQLKHSNKHNKSVIYDALSKAVKGLARYM